MSQFAAFYEGGCNDPKHLDAQPVGTIKASLPIRAYAVRLSAAGALQWVERRDGEEIVHEREPGTNFWQRLEVVALSRLPIDRWL